MPESLGGVPVRNTANLITPDTKICVLVYAPGKFGKTTLGATLDKLTREVLGKPSIFVAVEAADGGGTMSIQDFGVDFVQPTSLSELRAVAAGLETDTKYGGVILDNSTEVVKQFVQPYALKFASKMKDPRREAGVPARDDYQTMGEEMRKLLNRFVRLSAHPDLRIRKHLVVTALLKEKLDEDGKVVIRIQPDLPGAMADAATAMFQTVATIKIREKIVRGADNKPMRTYERVLTTEGTGVWILGDRTHCFPAEGPLDLAAVWKDGFVPRFGQGAATA